VARVVRDAVTARFRASLAACGIAAGGPTARALGRAIAALSEAPELPGDDDRTLLLEPDERGISALVHVRHVRPHNLWLWYRLNYAGDVVILAVENEPPE
jgi:hypothetical protein